MAVVFDNVQEVRSTEPLLCFRAMAVEDLSVDAVVHDTDAGTSRRYDAAVETCIVERPNGDALLRFSFSRMNGVFWRAPTLGGIVGEYVFRFSCPCRVEINPPEDWEA